MHSTRILNEKSTERLTSRSTKSTKILLKPANESGTMQSTRQSLRWTINNELLPSTIIYQLQDVFSRAFGSTAQRSHSASAQELGKYNQFRETYMLGVDE